MHFSDLLRISIPRLLYNQLPQPLKRLMVVMMFILSISFASCVSRCFWVCVGLRVSASGSFMRADPQHVHIQSSWPDLPSDWRNGGTNKGLNLNLFGDKIHPRSTEHHRSVVWSGEFRLNPTNPSTWIQTWIYQQKYKEKLWHIVR